MLPDTYAQYYADSYGLLDVKKNPKCKHTGHKFGILKAAS